MSTAFYALNSPTKFTEPRRQAIYRALTAGLTITEACYCAGIHKSTYYEWLATAAEDDAPEQFKSFALNVAKARSHIKERLLDVLIDHAEKGREAQEVTEFSGPDNVVYERRRNVRRSPRDLAAALATLKFLYPNHAEDYSDDGNKDVDANAPIAVHFNLMPPVNNRADTPEEST